MILVTGANGAVGTYVEEIFGKEGVYLTDIDNMDITNLESVRSVFHQVRPKVVIHLAAETDVDRCEVEPRRSFFINTIGTENIAIGCREIDALMVYVSTSAVFDGNKSEPYTEFDLAQSPANVYAKSKLQGEIIVKDMLLRYFIVRASWMIGGGKNDKKFVYKILRLMNEKNRIQVVSDKFGTITYAKHFLQGISELMKTERYGTYHMGNGGVVSRLDVARELVKVLNKNVDIIPINSAAFPLPAPRPRSEAIQNYKLELLGANKMPEWKVALREYVGELENVGVLHNGVVKIL